MPDRHSITDWAAKLQGDIGRDAQGQLAIRCPGPGHSHEDRSLSVWLDEAAPEGFRIHSFAVKDDDFAALRDYVRTTVGLPEWRPLTKANGHAPHRHVVMEYFYEDAEGRPTLRVTRYRPKGFAQAHPDGHGGWVWGGIPDKDRVPYKLPEIIEAVGRAQTVYVCEGEKAVLACWAAGLPATCSSGGAGKWPKHFAEWFEGATVIILADNDTAGRKHGEQVRARLAEVAASVRVVNIPGLPPGGDVADFFEAGGDPLRILDMRDGDEAQANHSSHLVIDTLQDLAELDLPPREYVLAPILPRQGLAMVFAVRGVGKTHMALGIAMAVATGGTFLRWTAEKPRRVLLVDGEMPATLLQERARTLIAGADRSPPSRDLFRIVAMDRQPLGVSVNLAEPEHQAWIERELGDAELLVFDNISTLVQAGKENEANSWDAMQAWLLQLRRRGLTVLLVHHAGRNESPRGTSKREDVLDTVIQLRRPEDYEESEGARFEVRIVKGRGVFGDAATPFEAKLETRDGADFWSTSDLRDREFERVRDLTREGKSVRDIADEIGLSKSVVNRIQAELRDKGDL